MATAYTPERLRELFHGAFDLGLWYDFLQHFFNATELKKTPEKILGDTLDEGYYLGCIDTTDSYRIGLFHYEIAKGSVANKRTGLRHLVRSFINPTWGEFDAALVVFNSGDHWRLSFICDIKGEETSPKRYTYLFGSDDQLYKTPVERFTLLKKKGISFEHLREAFSVEALSKEFFDNYRQHYGDFVAYITGKRYIKRTKGWVEEQIHEPHPQLQTQFAGDEKRVRDYIKKLLGRIVFLYYLQRKGWLGVPQDKDWGEGDLDFMRHLFEYASQAQKADFVEAVLEPLFYGALNTDRSKSGDLFDTQVHFPNSGTALRIPYLNGGLFEADENDQLTVTFPAEYFQHLLDFFSQYNFTIDENDPSDAQVGVDPEMLGRIFESLLEDNKEKGAYYTPKEIVQYMCRESLTAYLRTEIDPEKEQEQSEAIARFVKSGNDEDLCGTASGVQYDLRTEVLNKLKEVKICDPAIGSGAFPMGLLRELYHCRIALEEASISPAEIKSQIIKNNIYGVDIERGAVDIARLRFWLSLVVDEETPQPLPNLDYKIMQGNSLLESYQGVDLSTLTQRKQEGDICLFDDMADVYRRKLRQAVSAYYSETNHEHKEKLHQDISEAIEAQLTEQCYQVDFSGIDLSANTHFFLWHTWFDDVFNCPSGRNGFDIVIGNPPYAQISKKIVPASQYPYSEGKDQGKQNLYKVFIELAHNLMAQDAIGALIVQSSILGDLSASFTRELLLTQTQLHQIIEFPKIPTKGKRRVFESILQATAIILFQKEAVATTQRHCVKISIGNSLDDIHDFKFGEVEQCTMFSFSPQHEIPLLLPEELRIYTKIKQQSLALKDMLVASKQGNINTIHLKDIQAHSSTGAYIAKGAHIHRYYMNEDELFHCQDISRTQKIFDANYDGYLILTQNITGTADTYRIHAHYLECKKTRIVFLDSVNISYSRSPREGKYLTGLLNSRLLNWVFKATSTNNHVNIYELDNLPIPHATLAQIEDIATRTEEIMRLRSDRQDTTMLEEKLNQLVYQLYGISGEDICIIEQAQ